uniref:Squamous cell carcinoma antigen recognized by T-cells 3 n=1 Tax=Schmidtea mediterranea TaxID=79327 RepID=A0A023ZS96_SCHMD|nr:squamous cell carcinoma antigen recognized by T-cells 3 [Schmidtea mediterranea]
MKIDMYRENVLKNSLDYDSHWKLINALKHSEKMIEAKESRETMHIYYLLSPEMWVDWMKSLLIQTKISCVLYSFVQLKIIEVSMYGLNIANLC